MNQKEVLLRRFPWTSLADCQIGRLCPLRSGSNCALPEHDAKRFNPLLMR